MLYDFDPVWTRTPNEDSNGTSSSLNAQTNDDALLDAYSKTVSSAAATVAPAVVNIQIRNGVARGHGEGAGSGFFIAPDGFILTNSHVVHGAKSIEVNLPDAQSFSATVIGEDPETDLAVIRINAANLPFLTFADSKKLRVGQIAIAIGSPYGDRKSVV